MNQKNVVKSLVDQFILNGKIPSTEDLQKQCSGIKMERFEHHGIKRSFDQVIENQKILQRGDMPEIGAFGQMKMELDENESADCDIEQFFLCKKKPKLNSYDNNSIEESKHQRNAVTLHSKDNGNNASTTDKLNGDHDQLKIVRYNCDKKCTLHARDNNPPFKCPLCPYSWPQECDRIAHIKAEHPTFNGPEVRSATCPAIKLLITETTNKISTPEESAINKLTPLQALGVRMAAYRNPTEWDSDLRRDAAKFRPQYWHSTDPFRLKIPFPDGISRHVSILPYSETDQKMKSIFDEDKIVDDDESGDGGDIEQFLLSNKKAKWNRTDNYSIEERTPKYDVDGLYLRENDKSFGSSDQLNQLKAPSYKCDECDYCSLEKCDLDDHVQKLHTAKIDPSAREHNFKCHLCDYTGYRNKQITRHLKAVHQEKNLKCHLCNFASTHEWDRIMHVKTTHPAMNGPKVRMLKDKEAALRALGVRMAAFRKHKQWDTSLRRDAAKFRPPDYDPNTTYNMKIPFPDGIVLSICIPAYTEDDANVESVAGENKIKLDGHDSDGDIEQFFLAKKKAQSNPSDCNSVEECNVVDFHLSGIQDSFGSTDQVNQFGDDQLKSVKNKCDICNFCAPGTGTLFKHLRYVHSDLIDLYLEVIDVGEIKFKCKLCGYCDEQRKKVTFHIILNHLNKNTVKCHLCDYCDLRKFVVDQHIRSVHPEEKTFKCHLCTYNSPKECDRNAHIMAVHPSITGIGKPITNNSGQLKSVSNKCKICGLCISRRGSVYKHLRKIHSDLISRYIKAINVGNYKFKCTLCGYRSDQRAKVTCHIILSHIYSNTVKCHLCDYCDLRKYALDDHIRSVHSKEKSVKCHQCNSSLPQECEHNANIKTIHPSINGIEKPKPTCSTLVTENTNELPKNPNIPQRHGKRRRSGNRKFKGKIQHVSSIGDANKVPQPAEPIKVSTNASALVHII